MRIFSLQSGARPGTYNMALDEALLEAVRSPSNLREALLEAVCSSSKTREALLEADNQAGSILIVRTYGWEEPTLSLGVNQAVRDVDFLLSFYSRESPARQLVRRPTGGRAILHGEDISFSFVTNDPALVNASLKDAYALFSDWVRDAMAALEIPVRITEEAGNRDYLRSPICFETHTPSDLVAVDGGKLAGSAQLRRSGGILQHGAAFLKPYGIMDEAFSQALFAAVAQATGQTIMPFPLELVEPIRQDLETTYSQESGAILAKASTTSGSHLVPASS